MPVKLAHLTLGDSTVEDFHRLNHRLNLLQSFRKRMEEGQLPKNPWTLAALEREEQKTVVMLGKLMPRIEERG